MASVPTVTTGVLTTCLMGASYDRPSATTRERRSWSVTMPSSPPPPSDTSTEVAEPSVMRAAASLSGVSGSQVMGGSRISARHGCCARSNPLTSAATTGPGFGRASSDRAR